MKEPSAHQWCCKLCGSLVSMSYDHNKGCDYEAPWHECQGSFWHPQRALCEKRGGLLKHGEVQAPGSKATLGARRPYRPGCTAAPSATDRSGRLLRMLPSTDPTPSSWLGFDSRNGRLIVGTSEERLVDGILRPGEFAQICARPQVPWRGERLCVWSRCASSFFIHDVRIGTCSRFASGVSPIPADAFLTRLDQLASIVEAFKRDSVVALAVMKGGVDVLGMPFVLPTVPTGVDVSIYVEHIGTEPMRFVAGFFGTEGGFSKEHGAVKGLGNLATTPLGKGDPGPCTSWSHSWDSGSAVCRCGKARY